SWIPPEAATDASDSRASGQRSPTRLAGGKACRDTAKVRRQGPDRPLLNDRADEMKRVVRHTAAEMLAIATAIASTLTCSGPGKYVWVDAYDPPPQAEKPSLITPGDVIQARALGQDQIPTRARVRGDGKRSLPL